MCVLAMYDVRGIQAYIFRTNKVKDIIGASALVDNIIRKAFEKATENIFGEAKEKVVIEKWEKEKGEEIRFLSDETIRAQLLLIGGGNAYILYRSREECKEVNKAMAKYILDQTYSLQLAVSVTEMTGDYYKDYREVSRRMGDVKASMPLSMPVGALPIVKVDEVTGYPLTTYDRAGKEYISTESARKRENIPREEEEAKKFDNLITEKGEESLLAIVHIDGNSMGDMIRRTMQSLSEADRSSYAKSIAVMRDISLSIQENFEGTYKAMEEYLREWQESEKNTILAKKGTYLRRIVTAGDDITFVVNARLAIALTEFFLKDVSKKSIMVNGTEKNDGSYGISACAGIAFVHSHFPFSIGYEIAEKCCKKAKERAKSAENREGRVIGSWVDFQLCNNVQLVSLGDYRDKYYKVADGKTLLKRPYYVDYDLSGARNEEPTDNESSSYQIKKKMNQRNSEYSLEVFKKGMQYFRAFPQSAVKRMRNSYILGEQAMEHLITFEASRQRYMPDDSNSDSSVSAFDEAGCAKWYDILEMWDMYTDMDDEQDRRGDR